VEQLWKQIIGLMTSMEVGVTDLEVEGGKAHVAGFMSSNLGKGPRWHLSHHGKRPVEMVRQPAVVVEFETEQRPNDSGQH
jgi:hypothetical protein